MEMILIVMKFYVTGSMVWNGMVSVKMDWLVFFVMCLEWSAASGMVLVNGIMV